MKTDFTNIDVFAIVRELDLFLSKGTISNIYSVDDLLILKVNTHNGNKNLLIKKDSRLNLTDYEYPIPKYPNQFIISLRKLLRNRRILRVYQYNFDRIVVFELSNFDGASWNLVIELFNKGNYILLDENRIVKIAKRYLKLRNRSILANREYEFPNSYGENFLTLNQQDFKSIITNENEIVRTIARNINIAGVYSEEICYRADIDKTTIGNNLTDDDIDLLFDSLKNLRNQLMFEDIKAHIVFDEESEISVLPFDLELFEKNEKEFYDSFNKAVDKYFSKVDSNRLITPGDDKIKNQIDAQKKILKNQQEYIESLKVKVEQYYQQGDFIYANFKSLEKLLHVIKDARRKEYKWEEIEEKLKCAKEEGLDGTEYFKKLIPAQKQVVIMVNNNEIYLDINTSIGENANEIYSRGKKAKKKIKGTYEAMDKTKRKIANLEEQKQTLGTKIDFLVKKPEKKWYEKYHWFKSSDGYLVIGGRDASSNEAIYKKYLNPNDIVLHTKFPGSPLSIIKNPKKEKIPEKTLKEAADFVASYSIAWKENWGVADIFYVNPEQVSKSPPHGEYLQKGSFMIEGKKNFIKNAKTELAVGLKFIKMETNVEDYDFVYYPNIIAGPISAIKNMSDLYIRIIPSRSGDSKGELAKKIKNQFIYKSSDDFKKWVELLSLDDIILKLPNGFSTLKNS
ncbi:MAG: DUF814 domain-containing protein [Candidatus Lokiarchaeota archaeon]|nr:DUF814 domain-containing protein [Candidatus Lokiarchaeota archaeon]MBD3198700.1 DUF814 domain-containing protein [Candidatus Lokiarchaeota archaeon]